MSDHTPPYPEGAKSPGVFFLTTFLVPRTAEELPLMSSNEWRQLLREDPLAVTQRFIDDGLVVRSGLGHHLDVAFNVDRLQALSREHDLPISGPKAELIQRLVVADYDGMWEAVAELTILECSERGTRLAGQYLRGLGADSLEATEHRLRLSTGRLTEYLKWLGDKIAGGAIEAIIGAILLGLVDRWSARITTTPALGNEAPPASRPAPIATPVPTNNPLAKPSSTPEVTATSVTIEATPTEASPPIVLKEERPDIGEKGATSVPPVPPVYNLPPAILIEPTGLYVSPNRHEHVVPAQIPAGQTIYVMGKNRTASHLRVVWSTIVGWVPVPFTDYNGRRVLLTRLPIFWHEPPTCAVPITTQFALSCNWVSDRRQRIAVVVDMIRSRYGTFPPSHLSLTVNGKEVQSTKRQITERSQFLLKQVVFTLPGYVELGDTIGYLLDTTSDEPLYFIAIIFIVPDGCRWDTK